MPLRKPTKDQRKSDDPAQYKRFLEAAKEAEADETKEGADRAFDDVIRRSKDRQKSEKN
jgi:hypothetical protein